MAENSTDFIPCMLIPLTEHYLLLPNSTIAEVVPMPRLNQEENKPSFWLGQCQWQNWQLPVIDLESLVKNVAANTFDANKLCILHGINAEIDISVYGLPCYGIPQLIHLNESALTLAKESEESEFLHFQIQVGNKIAYIPNLDRIEATLGQPESPL